MTICMVSRQRGMDDFFQSQSLKGTDNQRTLTNFCSNFYMYVLNCKLSTLCLLLRVLIINVGSFVFVVCFVREENRTIIEIYKEISSNA